MTREEINTLADTLSQARTLICARIPDGDDEGLAIIDAIDDAMGILSLNLPEGSPS